MGVGYGVGDGDREETTEAAIQPYTAANSGVQVTPESVSAEGRKSHSPPWAFDKGYPRGMKLLGTSRTLLLKEEWLQQPLPPTPLSRGRFPEKSPWFRPL